jgi:hypothetical protein
MIGMARSFLQLNHAAGLRVSFDLNQTPSRGVAMAKMGVFRFY